MKVWAMLLFALNLHSTRLTLHRLEVEVVILFLFPTMTAITTVFELAAICISFCFISGMPKSALSSAIIFEDMRFSAKVLPIVSVNTLIPKMTFILIVEGAPDSLEVKHIKVIVLLHFMKKVNRELLFVVSEGT